jgi:glycosyltransferase involved in cell wall biosynthesis
MNAPTVLLSVNTAWNAWNFRLGLIEAIMKRGHRVMVAAPVDRYAERLTQRGCEFVDFPMDSNGTRPAQDLQLLLRYLMLFHSQRPVAYLGYTIKPNIYGSIAARMTGIPIINNIGGLGAAFIDDSMVTRIARLLYKFALRRSTRVFFQNAEDQQLFVNAGLTNAALTDLLPGSGIRLNEYDPTPKTGEERSKFRFLLVGRMLINKGVVEFADAARIVRRKIPGVRFQLLGPINEANPNSVSSAAIAAWEAEGVVDYLGSADDVRPYIANADCVVLPSYREGVPRTLLEAAAMARPIIATRVPGCTDAVEDGVNGLLCQARDTADLAEKMLGMIALPAAKRAAMGWAGRRKVEQEFDEALVINKYLDVIADIAMRQVQVRHHNVAMAAKASVSDMPSQAGKEQ